MNSICRFIPKQKESDNLGIVHFVYETEFSKMKQPFFSPLFYMYLVTDGNGVYNIAGQSHSISAGSLFFTFPNIEYTLDGSANLTYLYISFYGSRAINLFDLCNITVSNCVFNGFESEIQHWFNSIRQITPKNAQLLTESTIIYTFSLLCENETLNGNGNTNGSKGTAVIKDIKRYLENNYGDETLSLKKVAGIFSYSEKYLSRLFKSSTGENWNSYLNRLRIEKAREYLQNGEKSISRISSLCGYRDMLYFTKVFKKYTGITPHKYMEK